jgi:hypothetical protein
MIKTCPACGKKFTVIRNGKGGTKTCSRECGSYLRRLKSKNCKKCGSEFIPSKSIQHFCSQSCAAKYNNHNRPKKITQKNPSKNYHQPSGVIHCLTCGLQLENKYSKFCSIKCGQNYISQTKIKEWLAGERLSLSRPALRKYLTEHYGYKCSVCGLFDWNGKLIVLEIEHKDGNSENNMPDNLCFICPNCHSQTGTYKGKNKGKGRFARRQRYAEGKSY